MLGIFRRRKRWGQDAIAMLPIQKDDAVELSPQKRAKVDAFKANRTLRRCVQSASSIDEALKGFRLQIFQYEEQTANEGNRSFLLYPPDILRLATEELFEEKEKSFGILVEEEML